MHPEEQAENDGLEQAALLCDALRREAYEQWSHGGSKLKSMLLRQAMGIYTNTADQIRNLKGS